MLTQAAPGSFTPEIKRVDCPDEDSDLCLEVRFQTETDIAELDQKFEGDFSNYEGYFMNSGARVFASTPEFNNREMSVDSNLQVRIFPLTLPKLEQVHICNYLLDVTDSSQRLTKISSNSSENRSLLWIPDLHKCQCLK